MKDARIEEDAGLKAREHKVVYEDGDSEVLRGVGLRLNRN